MPTDSEAFDAAMTLVRYTVRAIEERDKKIETLTAMVATLSEPTILRWREDASTIALDPGSLIHICGWPCRTVGTAIVEADAANLRFIRETLERRRKNRSEEPDSVDAVDPVDGIVIG